MKNGGQLKCLDKALMFFSSIKEINRLIIKGMSIIYLKVTFEKSLHSQNFDFLNFL